MRFPIKEELKNLRERFPKGCRIVLDCMDDVQAPKPGTQGVCRGVDDAGNVLASWDTVGSLSVAFGADTCHRVASDEEIRKASAGLGKADTGARTAPGAGCVRNQQTVSSL